MEQGTDFNFFSREEYKNIFVGHALNFDILKKLLP